MISTATSGNSDRPMQISHSVHSMYTRSNSCISGGTNTTSATMAAEASSAHTSSLLCPCPRLKIDSVFERWLSACDSCDTERTMKVIVIDWS